MALRIETRRDAGVAVLELAGSLTIGPDARHIEEAVRNLLREGERKIVLDLSRVEHIDSTGRHAVAHCYYLAKAAGGGLRLAATRDEVRKLFDITRLGANFPFYPTVPEAR